MTERPENVIAIWDIKDLIPYETNAKKHPPEQVKKLAAAIKAFGWSTAIVVWKNGEIIAGHGRRLAALELGLTKVPVIVRSDLTKAEADAMRLSDNRVTSTEYDQAMIQSELQRLSEELIGSAINLEDLGFDDKEIQFSLADLGDMSDENFVDDISAAVETQQEANRGATASIDDTAAPVGDALGFKRISIEQSRALRGYMGKIETITGLSGVEGFMKFLAGKLEVAHG